MENNLITQLKVKFPGHTILIGPAVDNSFTPRYIISVDGKDVKSKWDLELQQEFEALHGVNLESAVFQTLVKEIQETVG